MKRKGVLITAAVVAVLAVFAYLQFREWEDFDWSAFLKHTGNADKRALGLAVLLIYFDYFLRAVRWKVFVRHAHEVSAARLTSPTMIGFTGLALLGRPGELVRPYLIARREGLSFASQMAVWAVERVLDMAAALLLVAVALLFLPDVRALPHYDQFREAGFVLMALIAGLGLGLALLWRNSAGVAAWVERVFSRVAPHLAHKAADRARAFGEGLHTMRDPGSVAQVLLLSLLIWVVIATAHFEVMRAYPLPYVTLGRALVLMASAMVGSIVQLPAVGGGTQLATIGVLHYVLGADPEVATSCGIMLWLVTFLAVVPAGLALAHREHLSLRRVTEQLVEEEEREHL